MLYFVLSYQRIAQELTVFNVDFPTDASNVKFRAVQWICTEVLLALAALINFLPRMWSPVALSLSLSISIDDSK